MGKVVADAEELPKAIVRRVVKEKLSQLSGDEYDVILHQEALLAFSDSARIFIHFLSATKSVLGFSLCNCRANDICKESGRTTINADDVLKALDEIEFSEFVEPLKGALNEFRKKNAEKRAGSLKTKEVTKKTKIALQSAAENGEMGKKDKEDESEDKKEEENDDSCSHED